jgi:hypothetical protein
MSSSPTTLPPVTPRPTVAEDQLPQLPTTPQPTSDNSNNNIINDDGIVDVIIVGAGPGGIAAAKTILDGNPQATIVLLERGPSLELYKSKGYDDALRSAEATSDPTFREDVPDTPIVVGTGVGGGRYGQKYKYMLFYPVCVQTKPKPNQ